MRRKKEKEYNKVLAVDIGGSTRMGFALYDNEAKTLIDYKSIHPSNVKNNLEHRKKMLEIITCFNDKYGVDILIFESIRLFSYGKIQLPTILSLNKVQTTIINEFSDLFDIYQVDVRSWKAKVLGSAKCDKNDALRYVRHKYKHVDLIDKIIKTRKKEIIYELNADLADAICISEVLRFDKSVLQDKNKMNYK